MPLVTTKDMLLDAQKNHYAIGAFNFENMEMAQAIVASAEKMNAPVMIANTLSTCGYGGTELLAAIGRSLAERATVPVAVHLDHGNKFDGLMRALRAGYTSIMIDGSHESFEGNIAISKRVTDVATPMGIPVEAELGQVGGKEDDIEGSAAYTDPDEAARFVEATGIASLAIGIGTAHGFYSGTPHLAIDVLEKVRTKVSIPLVLHGASGLPDGDLRECIKRGICKINFATELRDAYSMAVKAHIAKNPDVYDPKQYGMQGRESVMALVCAKIAVCAGI